MSGSAGDESINVFTETGAGTGVESAVPWGGAPEARKPVGERYTDAPARGGGTLAAPLGAADATAAAGAGLSARRCAARREVTGGIGGA